MQKKITIWLITALSLVLIGTIVFAGAMTAFGWDFSKLTTSELEINNYDVHESFSDLSILAETADITFVPAEDNKCSVVCFEETNAKHCVSVKDGVLSVELKDTRKWYEHIGIFNLDTPQITVCLPRGRYGTLSVDGSTGDVKIPNDYIFENIYISLSTGNVTNHAPVSGDIRINTSTGSVGVGNITAGMLDLTASTGQISVSNVICDRDICVSVSTGKSSINNTKCQNLISNGSTGDIILENLIVSENLTIERSTGDVKLESSDASQIFIKTDTGDVTGSLLSEKIFVTQTDTGRVILPETTTGGRCKVFTDTGDIIIDIISMNS